MDDPYSLDFFQTIKNVHFGGLAVDFIPAANLSGEGVPDTSRMLLSLWFRVPQATLTAATAQFNTVWSPDGTISDSNLLGVMPLITFGVNPTGTNSFTGYSSRQGPSFIGIQCGNDLNFNGDTPPPPRYNLVARLSYDTIVDAGGIFLNDHIEFGAVGDFSVWGLWAPFIGQGPDTDIGYLRIKPDTWHHILVSFDMNGSCTGMAEGGISSSLHFFWALDDANYNGKYLYPAWVGGYANSYPGSSQADLNAVASTGVFWIAEPVESPPPNYPPPSYTFSPGPVPMSGDPMALPTSSDNSEHLYQVEMAELQIWTNLSRDTSDVSVRRLFIDSKGKPVDPKIAAQALGRPTVLLHGSGDWMKGKNTGTLPSGQEVDLPTSGIQFSPSGEIKAYKPDPAIGK
jgi:hypothetical protein